MEEAGADIGAAVPDSSNNKMMEDDEQPTIDNSRCSRAAADGEEEQPNKNSMQQEGDIPESSLHMVDYVDHFSLRGPSSTVRFRGAKVMVYEQNNDQFLLEDRHSTESGHQISVKRMRNGTFGLRFLRSAYTLVTLLLLGFLFVFSLQVVLFLFLNLPVASGATSGRPWDGTKLIGTVLSIPLFLHALGSIMALGTAFVSDTWNGHHLFGSILNISLVAVEWLCFIVFLGIPAAIMCILLFAGNQNWWERSALTWMILVFILFLVFCGGVFYREFTACLDLVSIYNKMEGRNSDNENGGWMRLAQQAALLTQTQRYAGTREERYLIGGTEGYPAKGYSASPDYTPAHSHTGLYSKMTLSMPFCKTKLFDALTPPTRRYSLEEIRDIVPFVTNQNWSLEKMYCRNRYSRVIFAVKGPSALLPAQITSNLICAIVGILLVAGLILGVLVWMEQATVVVIVVAVIIGLCCVGPVVRSSIELYKTHEAVRTAAGIEENDNEDDDDKEDAALYQVSETITITKPRAWYCWTRLMLEVAFLFIWPTATLFGSQNPLLGILFLVLALFSSLRIYFDATWILSELGSIDGVDILMNENDDAESPKETSPAAPVGYMSSVYHNVKASLMDHNRDKNNKIHRALLAKARTSEVIGKVSRSRSVARWMWIYGVFAFAALILMLQASEQDVLVPAGGRPPIVQITDFYWPPAPDLSYPSCEMTKGFKLPGIGSSSLPDYAFLAALSYETPNVTQYHLDDYFGPGVIVDEAEFVEQYRIKTGTVSNPVYFKLLSIPAIPGYGIVSIRGSQTRWDFLVDAQLWMAAALAQLVRALIPLGWIWTPILDDLVTAVNWLEGENLKKVSYYRITTAFVNDLLENNYSYGGKTFDTLRLTGASLGGGLAIITGAQTRANAVGISGLNGGLSRHTFDPPVSEEALNNRVFNVIPDRDIISRIGDRSRLFQEIQCRAPMNSLLGCHSMWRSVCELAYTCGTIDRPVLCRCVTQFGYPEPIQNGTRTFAEACADQEEQLFVDIPE
jgi:lipase ATG15